MKPRWIIEDGVFDEQPEVVKALIDLDTPYEFTNYKNGEFDGLAGRRYDECIVFWGSIRGAYAAQKMAWYPGPIANFRNFDCLTYYAYFGKYLLNSDYEIMPLAEYKRRYEDNDIKMFVRPCAGNKPFSGQLGPICKIVGIDRLDSATPVVVSSPKKIHSEYRFIVANSKIIAGSLYMRNGEIVSQDVFSLGFTGPNDYDVLATIYVTMILKEVEWEPDSIYTIDIGMREDQPMGLLEINSLSSAGWYAANKHDIVRAVNEYAVKQYLDYFPA